jgi:nitroreductase
MILAAAGPAPRCGMMQITATPNFTERMSHPAPEPAQAFSRLMQSHRSIRQYRDAPVDAAMIDGLLVEALSGSSSSGNLNMISVIKTTDPERKAHLCELHFGQPMVLQAPLVLTFCADSFRTRQWLAQRGARLNFGNLLSWHVAAFDAIILSQTVALALESHGLGMCYMGTTLHSMGAIAAYLECPDHCLPVTSMVVGWPAEAPAQRDRLPMAAWVHDEKYSAPTPADIDGLFGERERRGWERYRAMGDEVVRQMAALGITSLAQFYTSKIKYEPDQFALDSAALESLLRERGFLG